MIQEEDLVCPPDVDSMQEVVQIVSNFTTNPVAVGKTQATIANPMYVSIVNNVAVTLFILICIVVVSVWVYKKQKTKRKRLVADSSTVADNSTVDTYDTIDTLNIAGTIKTKQQSSVYAH